MHRIGPLKSAQNYDIGLKTLYFTSMIIWGKDCLRKELPHSGTLTASLLIEICNSLISYIIMDLGQLIGSGNGLVTSGTKPLHEQMLIYQFAGPINDQVHIIYMNRTGTVKAAQNDEFCPRSHCLISIKMFNVKKEMICEMRIWYWKSNDDSCYRTVSNP